MNVFISWSKTKSMDCAIRTKRLLEKLDSNITAFVSQVDIVGGEDVQDKIIEKIIECDKLVLCFTKDNKKSPWLLFEAGYARGLKKTVIPILFDDDPNWHSWIDNPMNIAREIKFSNDFFAETLFTSLGLETTSKRLKYVSEYKTDIISIREKYREVDVQCEDFVDRLIHDDTFVLESPYFKDKTAFFLSGYESFELYKTIVESFLYTGKYLWIYGRKNMKLFSGNFANLFKYLNEKSSDGPLGMGGIDFRCLFLDPSSSEVEAAHTQPEIFKSELNSTIMRAKIVAEENPTLKKCFRLYSNKREEIIMRVDNTIIYSLPSFDAAGRPQLLTNSAFQVFSAQSDKGKRCIEAFEKVWMDAKDMC